MSPRLTPGVFLIAAFTLLAAGPSPGQAPPANQVTVDDFEATAVGKVPPAWTFISSRTRRAVPLEDEMDGDQRFLVVAERGNRFLRGYTHGEALRITRLNGERGFNWNLKTHPRLSWDWRALRLPEGASEKDKNDTGAAVYVTFDTDWLGRPKSIKYTYSSTLPVGTVVSFGRLKVIVAASGRDPIGDWRPIERDVAADYRRVFGDEPPDEPLSITLWSDSDDTGGIAEVDIDNIAVAR